MRFSLKYSLSWSPETAWWRVTMVTSPRIPNLLGHRLLQQPWEQLHPLRGNAQTSWDVQAAAGASASEWRGFARSPRAHPCLQFGIGARQQQQQLLGHGQLHVAYSGPIHRSTKYILYYHHYRSNNTTFKISLNNSLYPLLGALHALVHWILIKITIILIIPL